MILPRLGFIEKLAKSVRKYVKFSKNLKHRTKNPSTTFNYNQSRSRQIPKCASEKYIEASSKTTTIQYSVPKISTVHAHTTVPTQKVCNFLI